MSWINVLWPMMAATSLTLALICVLIWFRQRSRHEYVAFSVFAACVWFFTMGEWLLMRADSPQRYGEVLRWMHVVVAIGEISLAAFIRFHLHAGRPWLFWAICALRILGLPFNFLYGANLAYLEIADLRQMASFGGEVIALPVGVPSPLNPLFNGLPDLLLLLFLADASISAWSHGDSVARRRALVVGGTVTLFFLIAAGHATLLHLGLARPPYLVSLAFLGIVVVMSYELGSEVLRAARLSGELRQSEQRMDLAADAANLGLWAWNVIDDEIWVTDRGRALFAFSPDERLDLNCFLGRVHPEEREAVSQAVMAAFSGAGKYEKEYRILLPDGHTRWIRAWGRVDRDEAGKPRLMRGVATDVTERKEAEARASRMEIEVAQGRNELAHLSRVAMLGELSGALAHELNQPLAAILSNAQAAQRFLAQGNPDLDEIREILGDIVDADRRAGDIIRRLRALLRKEDSTRQPVNMNELVREVLRLTDGDRLTRGVEVAVAFTPGLPPVMGDRVQLQQVLLNLLTNAGDAMEGQTRRELTVRTTVQEGRVDVSVADWGMGIAAEDLERIFEPFITSKAQGMGLGLSICRTIIQAHGGKLWAENREEGGATFHFRLPVTPPAEVLAEGISPSPSGL